MNKRLFVPCGIAPLTAEQIRVDDTGTWMGSSFLYLRAYEWVRLGRMMLNNGVVDGAQVVASRWVAEANAPGPVPTGEPYGYSNQWWQWSDRIIAAHGYEGQHLIMDANKDVVVVRLGSTPDDRYLWVRSMLKSLLQAL